VEWFGNLLHQTQDFYAHSNWVELYSGHNQEFDPTKILTWKQVVASGAQIDPALRTGNYPDVKNDLFSHANMNKDNANRPYYPLAFAAAQTATHETAEDFLKLLKEKSPLVYQQLTQPYSPEERAALLRKLEFYRKLAALAGHAE
jgi:hypothetical protein